MENAQNKDNIEYEYRILYALTIIFIVMSHCEDGGFAVFTEFLPFYSFAISPFIFASGYFYKSKYEDRVCFFILKKFKTLIIPLYLWTFAYAILLLIIHRYGFFPKDVVNFKTLFISPLTDGHQFHIMLGSWFVFPLFAVHVLNITVRKILKSLHIRINEIIFFVCCLLLGVVSVILSKNNYNQGLYLLLDRILFFIPFFGLGTLYRKYKEYDKLNNICYFSIIIILLLIIYYFNMMPELIPSEANYDSKFILMPYIVGIIGTAFWFRISKILLPVLYKNKYVDIIAGNTYSIMINHLLGIKILVAVYAFLHCYASCFPKFDMNAFKTDWHYCFKPHDLTQMLILYVIAGIVIPILMQYVVLYLKDKILFIRRFICSHVKLAAMFKR